MNTITKTAMVTPPIITPSAIWAISAMVTLVTALICAFPSSPPSQSSSHRASFHLSSQQQATSALRHGLPKFHLPGLGTSVGLSFPSMRFRRPSQPLRLRRLPHPSSPTFATSAQAITPAPLPQPDDMLLLAFLAAGRFLFRLQNNPRRR